jgi:hypothetical protein
MAGYFEATGGGAAIALDEVEVSILRSLATQLLELIGPGPAPDAGDAAGAGANGGGDPLDALFAEGPSEPPRDPALARLFPDAYGDPGQPQDSESRRFSSEFRRFTEGELRARKRDDLLAMVHALDALDPGEASGGAAVLTLKPEDSRQWLGALNDLRLAIAARLELTDDDGTDRLFELPDDDPNKPMVMAYFWLGGLQESLVETMST